jgi:hypothetical protein
VRFVLTDDTGTALLAEWKSDKDGVTLTYRSELFRGGWVLGHTFRGRS